MKRFNESSETLFIFPLEDAEELNSRNLKINAILDSLKSPVQNILGLLFSSNPK
jgi:hypothetical protein